MPTKYQSRPSPALKNVRFNSRIETGIVVVMRAPAAFVSSRLYGTVISERCPRFRILLMLTSMLQSLSMAGLKNRLRTPPSISQPVSSVWPNIAPSAGSEAPLRKNSS